MRLAVFTHVIHGTENDVFFAYAPYVKEMNIWTKYADDLVLVAPLGLDKRTEININYEHKKITFSKLNSFHFKSISSVFKTMIAIPRNFLIIFKAMKSADHIHLRCPGNIGLLACLAQVFFPKKTKTAKYAGNWDPKAKQPLSYKLQKWILSNTFLTKNMQVLVYGNWENQSKNIKPFFTVTYSEFEKKDVDQKPLSGEITFLFVGTLSHGKQPIYAVKIVETLRKINIKAVLKIYGEGSERKALEDYISQNQLGELVSLEGNKNHEVLKDAYCKSHFVILPSKSEGWPKAVAEAMFWGCLPIASKVSCVANMLDNGNRGVLLNSDLESDAKNVSELISNEAEYQDKVVKAINWSRNYTTEFFEEEIKTLIVKK